MDKQNNNTKKKDIARQHAKISYQNIYIIIPTYNEAGNIEKLLKTINTQNIPNLNIIIVDDNSPDKTARIAIEISKQLKLKVSTIERPSKQGIGSAYITGFKKAISEDADLVFEMDADLSHDPNMISNFIEESKNADAVTGSRRVEGGDVKGWNARRNIQSKVASGFARALLRLKTKDVTTGYRCYRSEVLKKIPLDKIKSNGYAFQLEILWWCEKLGFKIKEIPISFIDREHGKSKLSWIEIIKFFTTLARLLFKKTPKK